MSSLTSDCRKQCAVVCGPQEPEDLRPRIHQRRTSRSARFSPLRGRTPLSGRILVVDPDPHVLGQARTELGSDGLGVDVARTSAQACHLLDEHRPDVVVMNAEMPGMSGFDTCARLRQRPGGRATPILLMTRWDDEAAISRAYDMGATDVLPTPLHWRAVRERLRWLLDSMRATDRLRRLAHYDGLTNLPNRTLFREQLNGAIASAEQTGAVVAVIFVDLNRFKAINDTFGHHVGDELLQRTSERLLHGLRASDTVMYGDATPRCLVGRVGGDEFTVLAADLPTAAAATRLNERIRRLFDDPFEVAGHTLHVSASTGIGLYPFDATSTEALLAHADAAMYYLKRLTHARRTEAVASNVDLPYSAELRDVVQREELHLDFQGRVSLATHRVVGVEALLRWQRRDGAAVNALELIGSTEALGMGREIGAWVLRQAMRQTRQWRARPDRTISAAVNLSHSQIRDSGFVDEITRISEEEGTDLSGLQVEIQETSILQHQAEAYSLIQALRARGVQVIADDVGTGYLAEDGLAHLPVDAMTIDRRLVGALLTDPASKRTVRALVARAHELGITVIAKGVETEDQASAVTELGCDQAQGFWFGQGTAAHIFEEQLSSMDLPLRS